MFGRGRRIQKKEFCEEVESRALGKVAKRGGYITRNGRAFESAADEVFSQYYGLVMRQRFGIMFHDRGHVHDVVDATADVGDDGADEDDGQHQGDEEDTPDEFTFEFQVHEIAADKGGFDRRHEQGERNVDQFVGEPIERDGDGDDGQHAEGVKDPQVVDLVLGVGNGNAVRFFRNAAVGWVVGGHFFSKVSCQLSVVSGASLYSVFNN